MNKRLTTGLATVLGLTYGAAAAETEGFVESNLISVLYHELGHALVDVMDLPIYGQEEDAADVASILLIDALFEEESAQAIAYDAAFGFQGEADLSAAEGDEPAYWDVHGPDQQRYYNLVCLFVGADPDGRADLAEDLDLPEERAETCEEEYDIAMDSWGAVFDALAEKAPGNSLRYDGDRDSLTEQIVAAEVDALNEVFVLPVPVEVTVEICNEPNAFYDPGTRQIIMCAEFEDWLRALAP